MSGKPALPMLDPTTRMPVGMGMPGGPDDLAAGIQAGGQNVLQKLSPQQKEYLDLLRQLTDACIAMVIKMATDKCSTRDSCPVHQQAQKIATIIDKLQELGPPQATVTPRPNRMERRKRAKDRR